MVDGYTVLHSLWMVTSYFISDTQHNIQETGGDRNEKKISLYFHNIYTAKALRKLNLSITLSLSLSKSCHQDR